MSYARITKAHADMTISQAFIERPLPSPVVVTITGCGGKTSLLWALAAAKRGEKTLVTTTTHMGRPAASENRYDYCWDDGPLPDRAERGVTLARNIGSFSPDALENIVPRFDYVFIEGDGSRMLPLKAWAEHEPVVAASTTITVGVLPLWTLGMAISGVIIHRLPLFLELTDSRTGDILEAKHIVRVITGGLFKGARGRKILFFNQTEDEKTLDAAKEIVALLPPDFARSLHRAVAGSIRHGVFVELPPMKQDAMASSS